MIEKQDRNLKQEILQLAEKLFYELGYDGTTFQKIADELGITKGAITYHFKNKHLIVEYFFGVYFANLRAHIDSFPCEYINKYWYYSVMYIYAYRQIMENDKIQRLFYHREQINLWQSAMTDVVFKNYQKIFEDFGIPYSDELLLMNTYMDMGARKRMYEEFKGNSEFLSIDRFAYYHVYLMGCLSKLDDGVIQENIRGAFEFADGHPHEIWLFTSYSSWKG